MRRRKTRTVHPLACACRHCKPRTPADRRRDLVVRAATRTLFITAALIAIPFIIAHALASAKGGQR